MKKGISTTEDRIQGAFKSYLLEDKLGRWLLAIALAIVIQFAIFKYFYPYASYIHGDSFSYLEAAFYNSDINTYMVGYSRFLRFFSVFFRSDLALVLFQYLLIQASSLFFLFTVFYFYKPSKITQAILICFMVGNPLFLHLANLVSSDGLFFVLSFIWFTLLLWTIHRPSSRIIVWHALVLFFAFSVRYNALIYPVISALVFLLSKQYVIEKIRGILMGISLCALFVVYTGNSYLKLTGTWQYSPFSGWQLANNAMYAYRYVDSAARKPVPDRFKKLDNMIRSYFDTTRNLRNHPQEGVQASTIYMWDRRMVLYKYRDKILGQDTGTIDDFRKWALMGSFYKAYGSYIIKQYPWHYLRYFLWPNARKYYAPWVEFLSAYNMGKSTVSPVAQVWFGYESAEVTTRMKNYRVTILDFYPILAGIMNVVFVFSLICFLILGGFKNKVLLSKGILLASTVWLVNAVFTIFSSPAALRFQSFPILLTITFATLIIDQMCLMAAMPEVDERSEGKILKYRLDGKVENENL